MMNLLKNKKLLRDLLKQGDLLNTINGGVSMTTVRLENHKDRLVIHLTTPGVPADAFHIILNGNKLTVFSLLLNKYSPNDQEGDQINSINIPMFIRTFDVPVNVDLNAIEAIYEEGHLRIILPYNASAESLNRFIKIKQVR